MNCEMHEDNAKSPESSLEIIKKPNKKRFSFEVSGVSTQQKKLNTKKKSKVINYHQNFSHLISQIRNNEELCKNVLNSFQNLWVSTHQKLKILTIEELEALYYGLLKSSEKVSFQPDKSKKIIHPQVICKKKWAQNELTIFIFLLGTYSLTKNLSIEHFDKIDWQNVSELIPNTSGVKLKIKWYSLQKSKSQQGLWLKEEEDLLTTIINQHKGAGQAFRWTEISEEFNLKSTRGVIRLAKHCREKWMNYLNPDLIKGEWTLSEDLQILERVSIEGPKWASLSKVLKGRNENCVKNRYLSLMNLHSSSRKKEKISSAVLKTKIEQKISDLKTKIFDQQEEQERDRLLAVSEVYLNKLASEDFIKELPNESIEEMIDNNAKSNNKLNDRHVTFSEDLIMASTKETFPLGSNQNMMVSTPINPGSNVFIINEPQIPLTWLSGPSLVCKNFSDSKINFHQSQEEAKREASLEDVSSNLNKGRIDDSCLVHKSSFYTNSLSKSFSKLSVSCSNKRQKGSPIKKKVHEEAAINANPEQKSKSWSSNPEKNFDSISSISKKTENNVLKEHSQSSIISLSEVHMVPSSRSFLEKSKSSNNGSSMSNKEKYFLISALNNLKSEGSKTSSSSTDSNLSKKHKMIKMEETEKK